MIKSITIVGSGRWAKQYIVTLLENKLTKKIIVISKTNISKIKSWVSNNKLQKHITIKAVRTGPLGANITYEASR